MPSNVKIKELPSGNFNAMVYDYTDANKKRHYKSITASSKRDVKRLIAEFLAERETARASVEDITVGEAIDRYIESKSNILSPSTIRGYRLIRKNNLQELMPHKLSTLNATDIQLAINREASTHKPKTVRNMHGLLSSALKAYAPRLRPETTLPQKVKPDIHIPTEDEMLKIFRQIKDTNMEVPIYLAALCGMRRSEITALKWADVDMEKRTITIKAAKVLGEDEKFVIKGTKTVAGQRTIRVFDPVMDVLKSTSQISDYVTELSPYTISKSFFRILEKLELPHYRFHDLRHYAVSVMLSLNIPKNYIADYVGHETEHMIDQVYGHIMKSAKTSFEDLVNVYYKDIFK